MSTIIAEQLETTISQTINMKAYRKYELAGLKAKLYMHNAPAGTFTLALKSGGNTLWSDTFTSAELQSDLSTANNYLWIWKAFTFSTPIIIKSGTYTLELSSSGYTYAYSSFMGWIKDYESIFHELEDTPVQDGIDNPHSFRLFEYKKAESIV